MHAYAYVHIYVVEDLLQCYDASLGEQAKPS